jgi:NHL repeat
MKSLILSILGSILIFSSCSKSEDENKPVTEIPKTVTVTTLAGSTQGDVDANGTTAKFNGPALMAIITTESSSIGTMYVTDFYNNKIKRVYTNGITESLALTGDALLNPYGIATFGTYKLFVSDSGNHKIKQIIYNSDVASGTITTIAGTSFGDVNGSVGLAKINNPIGIAANNSNVIFADTGNHKIKILATTVNDINTIIGNAPGDNNATGTSALINKPYGLIVDNAGNIYFADTINSKIKKATQSGVVTTIAGSTAGDSDGNATSAKFYEPQGLAIDAAGNIYVADTGNHKIKKIATDGKVTTIAGSTVGDENGSGNSAKFNSPVGIVVDAAGNLFISDFFNHKIKKITFN